MSEEIPELAKRWQARIDKTFPDGVIMTADDEGASHTMSFAVPRPEVVALQGLDPVVFVSIPAHDRNFSGRITAWEPLQDSPTVVRVTMHMGSHDEVMRWSGNISAGHAADMSDDRRDSLRLSEQGDVYKGSEWFA